MKITDWQRVRETLVLREAFITNLNVITAEDGKPLRVELEINRFDNSGDRINMATEFNHVEINKLVQEWAEATTNYEAKSLYEDMTRKK